MSNLEKRKQMDPPEISLGDVFVPLHQASKRLRLEEIPAGFRVKKTLLAPENPSLICQPVIEFNIIPSKASGAPMRMFQVHRAFICDYSPYFETALKADARGKRPKFLTVTDVEPDIFQVFRNWIYNQQLDIPQTLDWSDDEPRVNHIKLWLLGHNFGVAAFQNAVMQQIAMHTIVPKTDLAEALRLVYAPGAKDTKLREYLINRCAFYGPSTFNEILKDDMVEAWKDLANLLHKKLLYSKRLDKDESNIHDFIHFLIPQDR